MELKPITNLKQNSLLAILFTGFRVSLGGFWFRLMN